MTLGSNLGQENALCTVDGSLKPFERLMQIRNLCWQLQLLHNAPYVHATPQITGDSREALLTSHKIKHI